MADHYVMDYETIINLFTAVFTHYKEDKTKKFIIWEHQNDFKDLISFLENNITKNEWHISFNGIAFDAQITEKLLREKQKLIHMSGKDLASWIYKHAQDVIDRKNRSEFAEFSPRQFKIKCIDLFKMNHWDNKAKMSSLKWIQYSMDWYNVEEMPHPHYEPVPDQKTLAMIVDYCVNDVKSS